jgi:hypothetical protein
LKPLIELMAHLGCLGPFTGTLEHAVTQFGAQGVAVNLAASLTWFQGINLAALHTMEHTYIICCKIVTF